MKTTKNPKPRRSLQRKRKLARRLVKRRRMICLWVMAEAATLTDSELVALVLSYGSDEPPSLRTPTVTRDLAIRAAALNWWEGQPDRVVAIAQFRISLMCMPFGELHRVTEAALGRPVFNTEFAGLDKPLLQELLGLAAPRHPLDHLAELSEKMPLIAVVPEASAPAARPTP